ncbi:hypothetical protein TNIN_169361, partial [Trichonephila inaurata madagascariensis]
MLPISLQGLLYGQEVIPTRCEMVALFVLDSDSHSF